MDEERKKYLLDIFLKSLWTSLIIITVVSALVLMTIFLGWWKFIILCLLGLIAGGAFAAGIMLSPKMRNLFAIILAALGVLLVPAFAVYLGSVATRSQADFSIYNASLTPFTAYMLATFLSVVIVTMIWQRQLKVEEELTVEVAADIPAESVETEIRKETGTEQEAIEEETEVEEQSATS